MALISVVRKSDCPRYDLGHFLLSPDFFQRDKVSSWDALAGQSTKVVSDYFSLVAEVVNEIEEDALCHNLTHALGKFFNDGFLVSSLNNPRKVARKDDFLISRLRHYLEEMAIVEDNRCPQLFSTEFLVFRAKTKELSTHSLFALCMTKGVQTILKGSQYGTEHPRFYDFVLSGLPLPDALFDIDETLKKLVSKALELNKASKVLYKEAELLLLEELGLVGYESRHKLCFEATKKKVDEAGRVDAEYFQPKYEDVVERIETYKGGWALVGDVVSWRKGIEVGSNEYKKNGKGFLRVSDFSKWGISPPEKRISQKLYDELKDDYQVRKGDLLITKDGTLGISYVVKENLECVSSGAFLRCRLNETHKGYEEEFLSLYFNSICCQLQVERFSGGGIISHLRPSDFARIKIPSIDEGVQRQMAERVRSSHRMRKESRELLSTAKSMVEKEIEKGANN